MTTTGFSQVHRGASASSSLGIITDSSGSETVTAVTGATLAASVTATVDGYHDLFACVALNTINTPDTTHATVRAFIEITVNGGSASPLQVTTYATISFVASGPSSVSFGTSLAGVALLAAGDVVEIFVAPSYLGASPSLTNFHGFVDNLTIAPRH